MKWTASICLTAGLLATPALSFTFAEIDQNADGSLDAVEFAAAYPAAPEAYFVIYDQDGDGSASPDEVRRASELLSNGVSMDDLDLDDDGSLEREEVRHVFSRSAQAALAKFDKDGDGTVTLDEVRASDNPVDERGRGRARQAAKDRADVERGRGKSEQRGRSGDRKPDKAKGKSRKDG